MLVILLQSIVGININRIKQKLETNKSNKTYIMVA